MLRTTAIASGSNGNCYYIENENEAILIDAGISYKQIIMRMQNLKINPEKIKGVFITHEHIDHIRGIEVLSKRANIPIYITEHTYNNMKVRLSEENIRFIKSESCTTIGDFRVKAFPKIHDASDPCSYSIFCNGKKISILTDIGDKCENVISGIKGSDAIFLEANYDVDMLTNGPYPIFLKKRISGGLGHLSNCKAGALLTTYATPNLKYLFLSHLSSNNNSPEIAKKTFNSLLSHRKDLITKTIITDRNKEISMYYID